MENPQEFCAAFDFTALTVGGKRRTFHLDDSPGRIIAADKIRAIVVLSSNRCQGESSMPYVYDVFLSHNSKDKPAVQIVGTSLQQQYPLRCWLDIRNLVPGEPWQEALEDALEQCR